MEATPAQTFRARPGSDNRKCPAIGLVVLDAYGDHVSTCCRFLATWTQGHDHIQACVVSLFREAGYRAITRGVMYAPEMRVDALRGVTVDVSTVHDFHGSADNPSLNVTQNGTLCHQDLDLAPSQRAQAKVDQYREG